MFNLLHQEAIVKADRVVRKDSGFQKQAFSHRRKINFSGFEVWAISRDDLILSKLNRAKTIRSEMRTRDAASIIRNGYDKIYVEVGQENSELKICRTNVWNS